MAFHHNSIRKYTAALLDLFNDVSISYKKSTGEIVEKKIPVNYRSKEKSKILDNKTVEQILSGNTNILPRASLSLISLIKNEERITNKNNKINVRKSDSVMEFAYNSLSYDFNYEFIVQCRGMNEVTQIIEQIAPRFNPFININVWDVSNLSKATIIPVVLLDISIEDEDYSEISSNVFTLSFGIKLTGNLYQPIRSQERIKELKMFLNKIQNDEEASRESMLGWDVDLNGKII